MIMKNIFRPDEKLEKYDDFDIEGKIGDGYSVILLDVDNTITPHYQKIPDEKGKDFVRKLKEAGFKVIVFSNNTDERVGEVARALDCEYYCWALKPLPYKFSKVIREHGLKRKEIICMGDQLLTDILGGNLSRVHTIYVKPIVESDSRITAFNRRLERFVFRYILHEKV